MSTQRIYVKSWLRRIHDAPTLEKRSVYSQALEEAKGASRDTKNKWFKAALLGVVLS